VSNEGAETVRISAEYQRRASELLTDFYAWMRPSNLMLHEHALPACIPMLGSGSQFPLGERRIADIGCGDGGCCLSSFTGERMPRICAESTSARTVLEARAGGSPQADLRSGSASKLPWPHRSFDLVSQFTVFTSILDPELKRAVAAEMLRVLKPDGMILVRLPRQQSGESAGARRSRARDPFAVCRVRRHPDPGATGAAARSVHHWLVVAASGVAARFAIPAHALCRFDS
jgi:SAM-dependent methyltransferase